MIPLPSRRSGRNVTTTRGFALVVALTLLSFVLLLLLSLTTLTHIELHGATNSQKLTYARQNAILALEMALGEIQQLAGPDQRATAPASIDAAATPNQPTLHPYWTGVWQQNPSSSARSPQFLGWLASGNDTPADNIPDPVDSSSPTVWLVGEGSVDDPAHFIKLQKQSINQGNTTGHYAWWASDESTKANLALTDPASQRPDSERIQSFLVAQRTGIEQISEMQETYPVNDTILQRLMYPDDLAFSADSPVSASAIQSANKALFHDTTTYSQGILADAARGGLRKDLTAWLNGTTSPNAPKDGDFIITPVGTDSEGLPRWSLIRSYAQTRDNGDPVPPRQQTDAIQGIHPVITYSHLGIDFSCEGPEKPFRIQLFPRLVIWNPTSVTIAAQQYEFGIAVPHPGGARINFYENHTDRYLATLHLGHGVLDYSPTYKSTDAAYFRFTVDAPDIPPGASLVFSIADSDSGSEYIPGQSVMRADSNDPVGAYVTMTSNAIISQDAYAEPHEEFFRWEMLPQNSGKFPAGRTYAALRIKPGAGDNSTGMDYDNNFLYHVRGAGFGGTSTPVKTSDFVTEALGANVLIGPRTEIAMRRAASEVRTPWLSLSNFSAPDAARAPHDSGSNHSQTSSMSPNLTMTFAPPHSAPNPTPYLRASVGGGVTGGTPVDIQIREFLPKHVPLMSLGQLQNVTFSTYDIYPAWAIGNSLASYRVPFDETSSTGINKTFKTPAMPRVYDLSYLLNQELWDRYFFSTIPSSVTEDDITSDYRPPNARLKPLPQADPSLLTDADGYDTRAATMVIDGPFNVNSTSVKAWSALLASLNQLNYNPVTQDTNTVLVNPFSRYAHPDKDDEYFFSKTYRTLSPQQIDQLATYIVEEVKARGPFLSLSDFINRRLENTPHGFKGPLQAAIDKQSAESAAADRINSWSDFPTAQNQTAGDGITSTSYNLSALKGGDTSLGYSPQHPWNSRFAFAPGYLTQADILTALGPALTTRADTFRVRAYGDVTNPTSGRVEAQAWCEAIIQRLPEYVDGSLKPWEDPAPGSLNESFGRSFRIISLRWLSEDEI